jgi:energy-coupling factor transport system permease protein
MVLPFVAPGLVSNLVLAIFVSGIVLLSRVPLVALLRALRVVLWTGLFMFVFYLLSTPGRQLAVLGPVSATWEGLIAGVVQVYRLCLLVVVGAVFTYTTSPSQLAHGIEAVLMPFARLGLPVREFAIVLSIALRLVPILFEEIDKIVKAQEARGASIRSGPLAARGRGWVSVFVPIFVSAFRRADQLATAMEARGFRGANERTHLYRLHFAGRDAAAGLVLLAVGMLVLLGRWVAP